MVNSNHPTHAIEYLLSGLPSDLCKSFPQSANNSSIWGPTFQWSIGSPAAQNEEIGLAIGPHGLLSEMTILEKGVFNYNPYFYWVEIVVGTIGHYFYGSNNNKTSEKSNGDLRGLKSTISVSNSINLSKTWLWSTKSTTMTISLLIFYLVFLKWFDFWNWIQRVLLLPSAIFCLVL